MPTRSPEFAGKSGARLDHSGIGFGILGGPRVNNLRLCADDDSDIFRACFRVTRKPFRNVGGMLMQSGFPVPVSLSEIARQLQADTDTVRYWVKLLGVPTSKAGKLRCVSPEGAKDLEKVAAMVRAGTSPGDAVRVVRSSPADLVPIEPQPLQENPIREDLDQIKKSLVLLSEVVKRSFEENQAIRAENRELRQDLAAIRAAILPPAPQRQVIAWHPEPRKDPLEGLGFLERFWVELVHPERCRQVMG